MSRRKNYKTEQSPSIYKENNHILTANSRQFDTSQTCLSQTRNIIARMGESSSSSSTIATATATAIEGKPSLEDSDSEQSSVDATTDTVKSCMATTSNSWSSILRRFLPFVGLLVWPCMLTLPLIMTFPWSPTSYDSLFPQEWYHVEEDTPPKPLGLCLGILAVAVGQVFVLLYFYLHKYGYLSPLSSHDEPPSIQSKGAPTYEFFEGVVTHLSQPEGFVLLATYLSTTWMFHWMPNSYYSFQGGIQWKELALCLVLQDGIQYAMHRLEHSISPTFYQKSHKPHHKFTNPRMFDAFNGSLADTILMILVPLYTVANLVRTCNVWTYMAFGSIYANWLTLIHSEVVLPWDPFFRTVGFGTPGDHHVHHKFFKYNYGHLFMWFDQLCGTYRNPQEFSKKAFNPHV